MRRPSRLRAWAGAVAILGLASGCGGGGGGKGAGSASSAATTTTTPPASAPTSSPGTSTTAPSTSSSATSPGAGTTPAVLHGPGSTPTPGGTTPAPGGTTPTPGTGGTNPSGTTARISAKFGPTGSAKELEKTISTELGKAQSTVDIAMFIFTSGDLADAVTAAKRRGVTVRVLLDGAQDRGNPASNGQQLERAGVSVKRMATTGGARGSKFHHKFALIDGQVVLTGSYNWSVDADTDNYENLVTIRDAAFAQAYGREFESLWTTGQGGVGSAGDVVFSPSGAAKAIETRISTEIGRAQHEIVIALYQFTSSKILTAVETAQRRGVKVSCLFDANQVHIFASVVSKLKTGGADVKTVQLPGSGARTTEYHNKYCVIDGQTVVTGSFNWNVNPDTKGWENIVVIKDPSVARDYVQNFTQTWSSPVARP